MVELIRQKSRCLSIFVLFFFSDTSFLVDKNHSVNIPNASLVCDSIWIGLTRLAVRCVEEARPLISQRGLSPLPMLSWSQRRVIGLVRSSGERAFALPSPKDPISLPVPCQLLWQFKLHFSHQKITPLKDSSVLLDKGRSIICLGNRRRHHSRIWDAAGRIFSVDLVEEAIILLLGAVSEGSWPGQWCEVWSDSLWDNCSHRQVGPRTNMEVLYEWIHLGLWPLTASLIYDKQKAPP